MIHQYGRNKLHTSRRLNGDQHDWKLFLEFLVLFEQFPYGKCGQFFTWDNGVKVKGKVVPVLN
jgi:hypothetical protein